MGKRCQECEDEAPGWAACLRFSVTAMFKHVLEGIMRHGAALSMFQDATDVMIMPHYNFHDNFHFALIVESFI